MRILGLDPGLAHCGFGLVVIEKGHAQAGEHGELATPSGTALASRLVTLDADLTLLIEQLQPTAVAIELVMFLGKTRNAREVLCAIGVMMVRCELAGLPVIEYPVGTWKKSVTGSGRAEKREIQIAVRDHLKLASLPRPDHAADALGIALHHWWTLQEVA